jgi:tRNA nucleotidyltransferase (CCA-adding enzyme)
MDLIVTHKNADFDALSSLVAAGKLYPGSRLLLPGSQEKAVRNFLSLIKDKIKIETEKTCRMDDVKRLVIVDNRRSSRIGEPAGLLGKKGLSVHIYDHHPRSKTDIKADKDIFMEVGATVSILLDIMIKEGKFDLTPLEATLMLLGIYEETGSLSYSTTTKLDVDMVSRLLDKGANLGAVSSYLNRELSPDELAALIELLGSIEVFTVNGIEIAFARVDSARMNGEMGTVVHKLQDVENYPVLFAMFISGKKTKVLARSRVDAVDVNRIMGHFKGGGHYSAAYARVDGMSAEETRDQILDMIGTMTQPDVYARDIMSFPVRTVSQDEKVSAVLDKLKSFAFKGAPVVNEGGEVTGMITLGDLNKAVKRGMGHSRIKGYMAVDLLTADPAAPLFKLKEIILEKDKGRIPIIENNKLVGIVTRTDVLKEVHSSFFPGVSGKMPTSPDLAAMIREELPPKLSRRIREIGALGEGTGMSVFLVGGLVRDMFMRRKNYDLDIVVEGDAIKFGKTLAERVGASLVAHKKFGTCTLVEPWPKWLGPPLEDDNKFKTDIATARKEVYEKPASLPTVKFSSLRDDLYRRDFTVNAMAVGISGDNYGLFIDFFGGMKDLEKGIIRALHDRSFIDDPTRIFRAVRFEQRFGFKIENHTEYLITHAVKQEMFRHTENQRIREELVLILKERDPEKAVLRMKELHELRFIHPSMKLKGDVSKKFKKIRRQTEWYYSRARGKRKLDVWVMYLMVMLEALDPKEVEEVLGKFVFTRSVSLRLRGYRERTGDVIRKLSSPDRIKPSRVFDLLETLSHEAILYALSRTPSPRARRRIHKFLAEYNGIKLKIKGEDLIREGVSPGPRYKKILRLVLKKKLDGRLPTKKDEMKFLRELLRKRA